MEFRRANPADALDIARVHVASWQTTYAGLLPADYIAERTVERRFKQSTEALHDPNQYIFVAMNPSEEVIGFASGGASRYHEAAFDAEFYALYILKNYQRQGIGRMLVHALANVLIQEERTGMLTWVLAANPARFFYQSLGGNVIDEKTVVMGSAPIQEYAYGWRDIRFLVT